MAGFLRDIHARLWFRYVRSSSIDVSSALFIHQDLHRGAWHMSLKFKVVLILLLVFSMYTGLSFGIQRNVFCARFEALERDKALTDMSRVIEALNNEVGHLDQVCYDWAAWDDTYQFIQDGNAGYIEANMPKMNSIGNVIHLLYFIDLEGNVVWGKAYDKQARYEIKLQAFPPSRFLPTHRLLAHDSPSSGIAGILPTEYGPMMVASRPILTSLDEGPIRGTLIVGKFIGEQAVERLREQTSLSCDLWPARGKLLSGPHRSIVERIREGNSYWVDAHDRGKLRIYAVYPDVYGMPGLLLRVEMARDISSYGWEASRFALISIELAGLMVSLVTYLLLGKMVVTPVETLTAHAVAVGRNNDLSARLYLERGDEIGVWAREFDRMVLRLAEAQKRLLEQSYYSGMAEMAAGTLHNVRNALSPMTVQMDSLRQKLHSMSTERIQQAQRELARQDISEQRRAGLIRFSELALERLAGLVSESVVDAEAVARQAARVEEILAGQDSYSRAERLIEVCCLDSLVQDALPLVSPSLRRLAAIQLDPQMSELPPFKAQRIVLIQVFANLITNALESIQRAGIVDGNVAITAALEPYDGLEKMHVRVCDNGVGIEPENLESIFERAFSSKGEAKSGIGLHWCANALMAMNGHIYAESDGPGKGACFHVLLNGLTNVEGCHRQ